MSNWKGGVWKNNPTDYHRVHRRAWRKANPEKTAYSQQKFHATRRGIDWNLTFEQWIEWWGDDIDKRGRGADLLCMARHGDAGPYEIGNIYKATMQENLDHAKQI